MAYPQRKERDFGYSDKCHKSGMLNEQRANELYYLTNGLFMGLLVNFKSIGVYIFTIINTFGKCIAAM
jgi:hypothetical protein